MCAGEHDLLVERERLGDVELVPSVEGKSVEVFRMLYQKMME